MDPSIEQIGGLSGFCLIFFFRSAVLFCSVFYFMKLNKFFIHLAIQYIQVVSRSHICEPSQPPSHCPHRLVLLALGMMDTHSIRFTTYPDPSISLDFSGHYLIASLHHRTKQWPFSQRIQFLLYTFLMSISHSNQQVTMRLEKEKTFFMQFVCFGHGQTSEGKSKFAE